MTENVCRLTRVEEPSCFQTEIQTLRVSGHVINRADLFRLEGIRIDRRLPRQRPSTLMLLATGVARRGARGGAQVRTGRYGADRAAFRPRDACNEARSSCSRHHRQPNSSNCVYVWSICAAASESGRLTDFNRSYKRMVTPT
jgi:hypothetical protein